MWQYTAVEMFRGKNSDTVQAGITIQQRDRRLMISRDIIILCWGKNTKQINAQCGQNVEFMNFTFRWYIQGVPGGMDKTSGECSLC